MFKNILLIIFVFISVNSIISQTDTAVISQDTIKKILKTYGDKPNPGGLFLAPFFGADFPFGNFSENSNNAFTIGIKLEFASQKIYPFVFFAQYQSEKHKGNETYTSTNYINSMETSVKSFGVGFYILLNKYLKSNFTSPFFIGEVKFYNIERKLEPDKIYPGIVNTDSKVAIGAGLGFTLFIFDIITTYNYVKEYSSLSIRAQFHIPLIRF